MVMPEVIALGDVNVDIIAQFATFPVQGKDAFAYSTEFHCGGSAANAAMALAGMGIETTLIARVGPDPWASKALHSLSEAGVHLDGLQHDPAVMTGLTYIIVTPDGERTILGHRGANVFTDPDQIREEDVQGARLLHLSGYALLAEPQRSAALLALEMARHHGLAVTLDPGLSGSQAVVAEIRSRLPAANILLPNLAEAQQLAGMTAPEDCAQALLDRGVQVVALKLGKDGCLVGCPDGFFRLPGFAVEAQDSTGAGDSFAAGLIAGFLGGLSWPSAGVLGNALGATVTACVGAATGGSKTEEVLTLLREHYDAPTHCQLQEIMENVIDFVSMQAMKSKEEGERWQT
jgi:ribokinase